MCKKKFLAVVGIGLSLMIVGAPALGADPIYEKFEGFGVIPGDGVPTEADFDKDEVHETNLHWGWHRGSGRGARNHGGDFLVPKDRVLVGWKAETKSEHRLKGQIDWKIVFEKGKGGILIPRGIHTGARLNPGKAGGILKVGESLIKNATTPSKWTTDDIKHLIDSGGASFHGVFILKYVTAKDWKRKWAEKNL